MTADQPPLRFLCRADVAAFIAVSALILGYGECRTSSGGSGTYNIFTYPSIEDCKSKCRESKCVAMEYNSATMACKIHSEKVSVVEFFHAEPVTCWVMDSPAQC